MVKVSKCFRCVKCNKPRSVFITYFNQYLLKHNLTEQEFLSNFLCGKCKTENTDHPIVPLQQPIVATCKRCNCGLTEQKELCEVCHPFGAYDKPVLETDKFKNVTIGADPEFLFIENRSVVSASSVLGRRLKARIGTDGCTSTAELRPQPAKTALELTNNIAKLLKSLKKKLIKQNKCYTLYCGSGYNSNTTGGHIHFGANYNTRLLSCLQPVQVLLTKQEKQTVRKYRLNYYGNLTDIRSQPHGFEYRAPHSWLHCPEYAYAVLALFHSIIIEAKTEEITTVKSEALNELEAISAIPNLNILYKTNTVSDEIYDKITAAVTKLNVIRADYNGYRNIVLSLLKKVKKQVSNDAIIDEKAWKLNDIKVTAKLFNFNIRDDGLSTISNHVNNIKVKKISQIISVVGVRQDRQIDISFVHNKGKIFDLLLKYAQDNNLDLTISPMFGQNTIGFSRRLRTEKTQDIIDLLNKVAVIVQESD